MAVFKLAATKATYSENYIGIAEYAATDLAVRAIKGSVITSGTLVPLSLLLVLRLFLSRQLFLWWLYLDSTNNRVVRTLRDNGNSAWHGGCGK